jgi:hypothetical protein
MVMLSTNLVRMIESHAEQIIAEAIRRVRQDAELPHLNKLADAELRGWAGHILKHLGDWLTVSDEKQIASCYQGLGRLRFEEHVPLHESVRNFQALKDLTVSYVRNQGARQTTIELYAEEELEHSLYKFFDKMIYHVVRGYESAQRFSQAAMR